MKKTLKLLSILLACSLAFSCGEKEIEPVDPPQEEQTPTDPETPEDPETPTDPETPPTEVDLLEISTAEDLVKLATWVNAGTKVKTAMLKNDIDMASVTEWTPIGNAVCPAGGTDAKVTGNAWTGVFDGNGFKIKNLKMVANTSTAGANYGLFGVLAPGSLVQNFVIDSSCSLEVTATASIATGIVAGYVHDATIRDVTNHAPMTFKGKAGAVFMSMAMIGQVYCQENGITIDSCHNHGEIKAENTDNLEAGAKAYHIAGIVGFAHALSGSTAMTTVSDCSNSGNITSATGRSAGIVGAMNRNIQLVNCENTGNQLNTMPKEDGSRLGNITCNITAGCKMTGCVNRGNLVSTTKGRCGGITSLSNTAVFENCANYGEVLTDGQYRGLFWAYNTAEATWKNCIASGKVGTYGGGTAVYDEYTETAKAQYLGVQKSGTASSLIDITYLIGVKEPDQSDVQAELSILFIGNSFTMDAVTHLPGMLQAAGLDKVHMIHMYYGGRLVSQYNSGWTTSSDYKLYECLPGSTTWTTTNNANLAEVAASKKWDIVTIQEHTGNAAAWTWNATAQSNIQGLVDKVKQAQGTHVPKFHYIMSQAYFNMGKIGSGSQPSITWKDQAGMWDVISAFGKSVMDNCTFDGIISTGVMLQNLRSSSIDNHMNLTRDGYHMDNGIARYGASCTVFESLITPKFNVTLDNNSYRYSTSNTTDGSYTTPVTDENAPIALQAARYAIEKPYEVTSMSDVGPGTPDAPAQEIDLYEISTAADLVKLATLVNDGSVVKKAVLKNDIDMASVTSWTPIGNGIFTGSVSGTNKHVSSYYGAAFTGEFDGQGHSIRNLKMVADLTSSQTVYGLFGILDKAKVSNLTIGAASGDASELTFHAANGADVGVVAGAIFSSTIENCVNYAPMHAKGTGVDNVRATMGAFAGFVYADETNGGSVLKNLTNHGSIKVEGGKNTKNGATSVMGAGIAGLTNGTTTITSARNLVYNCVNHGDMVSSVPRTAGIVAAINQYTDVELCKNYGDQTNSNSGTRVGMISPIMGPYTSLKDCENHGDAIMTGGGSAQVGGLICLLNADTASISGGGNYGKIIGDIAATSYKGLLVANFSKFKSVDGVVAGGAVGTYNGGNYQMETITADNYMQYIGKYTDASKITNITFKAE